MGNRIKFYNCYGSEWLRVTGRIQFFLLPHASFDWVPDGDSITCYLWLGWCSWLCRIQLDTRSFASPPPDEPEDLGSR